MTICHGREAVCAVRRYSCQSDRIQSYVRSRSQPGGCLDDEDVARRATNTWERRSACKAGARLTCLLKHYEQCHGIRDSDRDTTPLLKVELRETDASMSHCEAGWWYFIERKAVQDGRDTCGGNRGRAAVRLRISYAQVPGWDRRNQSSG